MNNDQRAKCFCVWKECWAAIQETSAAAFIAEEKDARMAITRKAIGEEKSWGAPWGQREVDRLLAVMWAISRSADLDLQLRQLDQPLTRAEGSVFCQTMLEALEIAPEGREAYLNGICRRIHKKPLCDIDDEEWRDVLAALNHTRQHKAGVSHYHPRSPHQGRKGQRTTGEAMATIVSSDQPSMPATDAPARTGTSVPGGGNPF